MVKKMIYKSTVQSKRLTPQYNVVNIDKSTYILLRNFTKKEVQIETQYGGIITLRLNENLQIYAPLEYPICEVWRLITTGNDVVIEVVYTYQSK